MMRRMLLTLYLSQVAQNLEDAIEEAERALPDECAEERTVRDVLNNKIATVTTYPAMDPLKDVLQKLRDAVEQLEAGGEDR